MERSNVIIAKIKEQLSCHRQTNNICPQRTNITIQNYKLVSVEFKNTYACSSLDLLFQRYKPYFYQPNKKKCYEVHNILGCNMGFVPIKIIMR